MKCHAFSLSFALLICIYNVCASEDVTIYEMSSYCGTNDTDSIISLHAMESIVLRATNEEKSSRNCSVEVQLDQSLQAGLITYINRLVLTSSSTLTVSSNDALHVITSASQHPERTIVSLPHKSNHTFVKFNLNSLRASDNASFEIIFTMFSVRNNETGCPRERPYDCKISDRCISDKLVCNTWNNCGDYRDEWNCTVIRTRSSPSMFLAILLRLFIFFLVIAVLRVACLIVGCKSRDNQTPDSSTSSTPSRRSNDDLPPPYPGPGPAVSPSVSQLIGAAFWKPETPPPTYKNAVQLEEGKYEQTSDNGNMRY